MDAETLGYALLFSLPTGVGVALAILETTAGTYRTTALAGGALAAVAIFALIVLGRSGGEEDPTRAESGR
jgi:hypothetical protein